MKAVSGIWIGWIAIFLALAGYFYEPYSYWLAGGALILGIIALVFPHKTIACIAIFLAAIVLFLPFY